MQKLIYSLLFILAFQTAYAQIGGTSTYRALSLHSSPRVSAIGGSGIGLYDEDINLAIDNPAFIQPGIHKQLAFSNNFYFANINHGALAYAHNWENIGTFAASVKYVAYGKMEGRDVAGNFTSNFRAGDYVFQLGYGSSYKEKFLYGANLKLIYSHLESYNSVGIAVDLSGAYYNEKKQFTFSAILRNVGLQLSTYDGDREKLPIEFTIGLSKRFEKIPVRIHIAVHNLQKPDISYQNPDLANETDIFGQTTTNDITVIDKIFRHFIFGAEIYIAKPFSLRFGYNHLERRSLANPGKKGLSGITMGAGIHIKQFSFDYGFSKPHSAANLHHVGLRVNLSEFLGASSSQKKKRSKEENLLEN